MNFIQFNFILGICLFIVSTIYYELQEVDEEEYKEQEKIIEDDLWTIRNLTLYPKLADIFENILANNSIMFERIFMFIVFQIPFLNIVAFLIPIVNKLVKNK